MSKYKKYDPAEIDRVAHRALDWAIGSWGREDGRNDKMWRALVLYLPTKFIDLRDRDYQSIPIDDFLKLAWKAGDGFPKWISEKMDCDNIAVIFMGAVYSYWARKFKGNRRLAFGYIEAMLPGMDIPPLKVAVEVAD